MYLAITGGCLPNTLLKRVSAAILQHQPILSSCHLTLKQSIFIKQLVNQV